MKSEYMAAKMVHYSLLLIVAIFLLTGFGITAFRIVETITFGLLDKALTYRATPDISCYYAKHRRSEQQPQSFGRSQHYSSRLFEIPFPPKLVSTTHLL